MPLARIISHSHEHCRELAVDLLARGYAVEIVSPDRIPDNFADLELRVDADTPNALTANVAAHTGEHSSFLDFVHHLGAPMGDFVRRPPRAKFESVANPPSVNFNAELSLVPEVETPSPNAAGPMVKFASAGNPKLATALGPECPVPPQIPIIPDSVISVLPDAAKAEPAVSGIEGSPTGHTRKRPKRGITIVIHRSRPKPRTELEAPRKAASWFLRVTAGFGLIVALSAIPIVGLRGGAPLVARASADSQRMIPIEAGTDNSSARPTTVDIAESPSQRNNGQELGAAAPGNRPSQHNSRVEITAGGNEDLASEPAHVYRDAAASRAGSRVRHGKMRRAHQDETIAQDTVTYLDRGTSGRQH